MTDPASPARAPINGWLALDKPLGLSSAKAVAIVKRVTGAARVGHGGTLDPLATGILPIALGEATKTVQFVMGGRKSYRFTVRFGEARSTDDAEGEVIATSAIRPQAAAIEAALPAFVGDILQVPPAFSALQIGGKRAYKAAREGTPLDLAPRRALIHRFELCGVTADEAELEVRCGKGVYVRALARDLAQALGTVGYVSKLRRTAVGPFGEPQAISLETLETLGHSAVFVRYLFPVEIVLADIPALILTADEAARLKHGQAIGTAPVAEAERLVQARCDNRLIAIAEIVAGQLRPIRVFNL
ncbi:MAG: tRNA pseudouridine(55) synthase TruB [Alphaproteobacteria bacterium]|nr:tRNA pseudouridine(55) synthase TruB [Alphaproteobacteria bacterium]